MNEPVTYKNPYDITVVDRRYTVEYQVQRVSGDLASIACYDVEHWDMVVTLTPKHATFEVGDIVKYLGSPSASRYKILAVVGEYLWAQHVDPGSPPFTISQRIVSHV